MKIAIKHGRIIDPAAHFEQDADMAIQDGKIIAIGVIPEDFSADKTIDAKGCWVFPGIIDLCCRPQMAHPGGTTWQHEAQAAQKRGITSLCIPPDADPVIDSPHQALRLQKFNSIEQGANLFPLGALTTGLAGHALADLSALAKAGCIAFSHAQKPLQNLTLLRNCYEYAASFHLTVFIQPQDEELARHGVAHEGFVASRLGLPGIPVTAETIAIATHLLLIEQCQVRAHFTCLSSLAGVELIKAAKARGLAVTCDVAMHHLHLTENDVAEFDPNCHLYPPLRSFTDKLGLIDALRDGTIDAICSDHRPLDPTAKLAPFGETTPGMSTIDSFLSLGIHLIKDQQLSVQQFLRCITQKPAQILGLNKGSFDLNQAVDLCIVDPNRYWQMTEVSMVSRGKNSAFKGWELPGVVTHTIQQGQLIHEA